MHGTKPQRWNRLQSKHISKNDCYYYAALATPLSLVHTSDGDRSTKFHTNPVKRRRNRREWKGLLSSVTSLFCRVCMEFRASVSVSAFVFVASVNQALLHVFINCNTCNWKIKQRLFENKRNHNPALLLIYSTFVFQINCKYFKILA